VSAAFVRRVPIVAGNWKMHYGPSDAHDFATAILGGLTGIPMVERVLCPPAVSLTAVHAVLAGSGVRLGAQNMYFEPKGAYTGEIAPTMLQGLCDYVILGHSERRGYFGETDELVNRKALSAFAHNLRPIVCVGERPEDRDAGRRVETVPQRERPEALGGGARRDAGGEGDRDQDDPGTVERVADARRGSEEQRHAGRGRTGQHDPLSPGSRSRRHPQRGERQRHEAEPAPHRQPTYPLM